MRGSDATPLLLAAARELEPVDPTLARATYLEALTATTFAGRLARGGGAVEVSEAALAGPPMPDGPRPSDLLLQGLAVRFTEGYAAGAPLLKEAVSAFQSEAVLPPEEAQWLWFACWIALSCGTTRAGWYFRPDSSSSSGGPATSPRCRSFSPIGAVSTRSWVT